MGEMNKKIVYGILLALILVGSLFLFFYQLKTVPGGLFPDAAANGLDAQEILNGRHTPFFERGNGRESLFFYLMAVAIKLWGVNNWSVLIPGAMVAFLLVVGVYLLAKEWFNREIGLIATVMTAVSYWLFTISRSGFRAILVPFFLVYFFYFLTLAVRQKDKIILWSILAGLSFGLGFYSYISYRMVLALALLFFVLLLIARYTDRKKYPSYLKISWWFTIVVVVVVLPLAIYFFHQPEAIIGRAGQVSIFSPELSQGDLLGTFGTELKTNLTAFWGEGDLNYRHNISGRPLVDSITGLLLLGGLFLFFIRSLSLIKNIWRRISFDGLEYFLVFISFWLMLVPGVMSAEGSPHGLRVLGMLPWIMIMAAWFLMVVSRLILKFLSRGWARGLAWSAFSVVIVAIVVINLSSFWTGPAQSADYYYAFRKDLTFASDYLNQQNDRANNYLVLDEYSQQTTEFLTSEFDQPYQLVDPAKAEKIHLISGQKIVFTTSTLTDADRYQQSYPNISVLEQVFNDQSREKEELIRVYGKR
jgi:4-amino-4-deoxy-L-arabinose transferase-like glycosyltransferase